MNWKAVSVALSIMNAPAGLGIGARHITVSTVGVLPGIAALGQRPEQFRLALSIHAPSEGLRRMLMPVNTKYPLAQILEAAKAFKRRVTFEYVMLDGVNDAEEHALALAKMARDCGAFVNLIPLHPGGSGDFQASPPRVMRRFAEVLRGQGVEVAIRKSRGLDIAAACGQLRVERLRRRLPVAPQAHREVEIARTIG
jgi:23S rRNA (adenine2503-C2)-methyltransferase